MQDHSTPCIIFLQIGSCVQNLGKGFEKKQPVWHDFDLCHLEGKKKLTLKLSL